MRWFETAWRDKGNRGLSELLGDKLYGDYKKRFIGGIGRGEMNLVDKLYNVIKLP
jgi:hypothetical protein